MEGRLRERPNLDRQQQSSPPGGGPLIGHGKHYGWSVFKGSYPSYPNRQLDPTPHVTPTIEHSHSEFRSLTGGVVYPRQSLAGTGWGLIYGDYSTVRIWAVKHDEQQLTWHRKLADTMLAIAGFRNIPNGDLLIVDHLSKTINHLKKSPATKTVSPFRPPFSTTGLFYPPLGVRPRPAHSVLPYFINAVVCK
ncbi:MAG: hypothetical protein M2R45_01028 [Verrucomicrobia subdivision 3 bacterium]|nr:hypothetical protein [Limisphaerales bacterium]MCS1414140.1 hypothetical protein [Limisphaerales bacterium]